jgi:hypothetical protein
LAHPELVHSLVLTGSSGLYERSFGETFPRRGDRNYIKKKTEEVFYNADVATEELVDEVFGVVNDRPKNCVYIRIHSIVMGGRLKPPKRDVKDPDTIRGAGSNHGLTHPGR